MGSDASDDERLGERGAADPARHRPADVASGDQHRGASLGPRAAAEHLAAHPPHSERNSRDGAKDTLDKPRCTNRSVRSACCGELHRPAHLGTRMFSCRERLADLRS